MSIPAEQRRILVAIRIDDARQSADDAELLLERGSRRGAANRIYYAMFYALSALALNDGVSFKTHSGLVGYFQKTYIKPSVFGREHGRAIQKAFNERSEADYEDFLEFDEDQQDIRLREARALIEVVAAAIERGTQPTL